MNMVKWIKRQVIIPVIHIRPLSWFTLRNWYSIYRWTHPLYYEKWKIRLIDIGMITVGYRKLK